MAVLTLVGLSAASCDRGPADAKRFLSIGTGGTGGIYYPLGGALASLLSAADSLHQYTAEVTGGSVENTNRIMKGEIDLGFAISTTVYEAYHGGEGFATPDVRLRVVAPLYPNVTHVLVRAGSTANGIADLKGQRVSVGAAGSGTEQVSKQLLAAYGLTYDSIDARYLSFTESAAALADGAIDAAIFSVGYPAAAVLEAMTTGHARLLPVDADHASELAEQYPYYSVTLIPDSAYPGLTADVPTVGVMNWIIAREDLPNHVVDVLLDVLRDHLDDLEQVVAVAGQINLTNLLAAPIPLHAQARHWLDVQSNAPAAPAQRDAAVGPRNSATMVELP